jgi:hypothetical protein
LFVAFVLGLVGLAVEHFHSSWINSLRNTALNGSTRTHHHRGGSKPHTSSSHTNALTKLSSNTKGATYSVPTASTYTLVIVVPDRCYIGVASPPNSKHYVFASAIVPSQGPKSIPVSGSSSLELGARTTSITVEVAGKSVGEISPAKSIYIYTFVPSGS